jgi:hypothetical protein
MVWSLTSVPAKRISGDLNFVLHPKKTFSTLSAIFRHHVVSFDHPVGEGHANEKLKTKPDAAEITLDLGDFG